MMPAKPVRVIKKPTAKMVRQATLMAGARKEMMEARKLGDRHILELEAEAAMFQHAMNLAEEMWKHYQGIVARSKKPKKDVLEARDQAENDFRDYSRKFGHARAALKKRMAKKKLAHVG